MSEILVVEDEPAIAESVAYALRKADHQVSIANSLTGARAQLAKSTQLVILDLMLPDGSGFDWIAELAPQRRNGLAIIVLSSRDSEEDRVRALEIGADDYVTKPFSPREIVARVTAIKRRLRQSSQSELQVRLKPRLEINTETRRARIDGNTLDLTRVEFDLLDLLHSTPGHVFRRCVIIDKVWGEGFALSDRTIDSHIKALRKKLSDGGGKGDWIETVRGVGYRAREEEHPA